MPKDIGFNFKEDSGKKIKATRESVSAQAKFQLDFMTNIKALIRFKKENGHLNLPETHELFEWTNLVRDMNTQGKLQTSFTDPLSKMGFQWAFDFDSVYPSYVTVVLAGETIGNHHQLYQWCKKMKQEFKEGKLSEDEVDMLMLYNFRLWGFGKRL